MSNLKITAIDSQRMVINIKKAKIKKDRIALLSKKILNLLREYYKEYKKYYRQHILNLYCLYSLDLVVYM